jgi:hypothetical protein
MWSFNAQSLRGHDTTRLHAAGVWLLVATGLVTTLARLAQAQLTGVTPARRLEAIVSARNLQ